jgi:hypothetical protein
VAQELAVLRVSSAIVEMIADFFVMRELARIRSIGNFLQAKPPRRSLPTNWRRRRLVRVPAG